MPILLNSISCKESNNENIYVDFNIKDSTSNLDKHKVKHNLKFAISGMISPRETYVSYIELIKYLEKKLNLSIEFIQKRTYQEVNDGIFNGELDFAMICSGAYVDLSAIIPLDIIAVPQCNGVPFYSAYIITNKNSKISTFEEIRGKDFAFTDPLSNTGKLYPTKRVKELGSIPEKFFSDITYTYAHDNSINLVNRRIVDGASVDGLIFDYLAKNYPSQVSNVNVIERSENFGIPPIICKLNANLDIHSLRKVLYEMNNDSLGNSILRKLNIDKFIPGYDSLYNSIRTYKDQVMNEN